jgi:putative ABC transport system permease protein
MQTLWLDFSLAFRNIVRQKRRSIIALGSIAFGITALILASGFIEYIFWAFREATIKSQLGHLQIVRPGYHDEGKANPYAFLLPDAVPELEISNEQRIKTIAPRIAFSGLVSHDESTISFIGEGINPELEALFGDELRISTGKNLSANETRCIIMGEGLARNLGAEVNTQVVVLTNTASGGINAVEVPICGLFSTVSKAYDDTALRMPIEMARQLLRTKGSHVWVALLNDTEQTNSVLAELRTKLQKNDFEIVPWYALAEFYNKTVVLFTKQIHGIRLIIALIILLSISNTMTMSVMERIGEIGTSMALGVKRTGIMRLFLSEGILLGGIGGILGLLMGLALAEVISSIGIPMPAPPGKTHGYIAEILVTWKIGLESFALAVVTTLLASIYPAWKASRMQIVDALRHNR